MSLCRKLDTELPDFKAYFTVGRVAFTVGKSCTACHQTPPPPPARKVTSFERLTAPQGILIQCIYALDWLYCTIQTLADSPSYKELQNKFGGSNELIESARSIISGDMFKSPTTVVADLTNRVEAAKQVSACSFETGTSWGQEVYSMFLTLSLTSSSILQVLVT